MFRKALAAAFVGTALVLAGPAGVGAGPAAADQCLSQSETWAAVQKGQAVEFSRFYGRLLGKVDKVLGAQLCDAGGHLVYEVQVVVAGRASTITLDSRSGAPY